MLSFFACNNARKQTGLLDRLYQSWECGIVESWNTGMVVMMKLTQVVGFEVDFVGELM
jgi:hypothetical protein